MTVRVKNIDTRLHYVRVIGKANDDIIIDSGEHSYIEAGQTASYSGSFIMPNSNVTLWAFSYYFIIYPGEIEDWVYDDLMMKEIALEVLTPQFSPLSITEFTK